VRYFLRSTVPRSFFSIAGPLILTSFLDSRSTVRSWFCVLRLPHVVVPFVLHFFFFFFFFFYFTFLRRSLLVFFCSIHFFLLFVLRFLVHFVDFDPCCLFVLPIFVIWCSVSLILRCSYICFTFVLRFFFSDSRFPFDLHSCSPFDSPAFVCSRLTRFHSTTFIRLPRFDFFLRSHGPIWSLRFFFCYLSPTFFFVYVLFPVGICIRLCLFSTCSVCFCLFVVLPFFVLMHITDSTFSRSPRLFYRCIRFVVLPFYRVFWILDPKFLRSTFIVTFVPLFVGNSHSTFHFFVCFSIFFFFILRLFDSDPDLFVLFYFVFAFWSFFSFRYKFCSLPLLLDPVFFFFYVLIPTFLVMVFCLLFGSGRSLPPPMRFLESVLLPSFTFSFLLAFFFSTYLSFTVVSQFPPSFAFTFPPRSGFARFDFFVLRAFILIFALRCLIYDSFALRCSDFHSFVSHFFCSFCGPRFRFRCVVFTVPTYYSTFLHSVSFRSFSLVCIRLPTFVVLISVDFIRSTIFFFFFLIFLNLVLFLLHLFCLHFNVTFTHRLRYVWFYVCVALRCYVDLRLRCWFYCICVYVYVLRLLVTFTFTFGFTFCPVVVRLRLRLFTRLRLRCVCFAAHVCVYVTFSHVWTRRSTFGRLFCVHHVDFRYWFGPTVILPLHHLPFSLRSTRSFGAVYVRSRIFFCVLFFALFVLIHVRSFTLPRSFVVVRRFLCFLMLLIYAFSLLVHFAVRLRFVHSFSCFRYHSFYVILVVDLFIFVVTFCCIPVYTCCSYVVALIVQVTRCCLIIFVYICSSFQSYVYSFFVRPHLTSFYSFWCLFCSFCSLRFICYVWVILHVRYSDSLILRPHSPLLLRPLRGDFTIRSF